MADEKMIVPCQKREQKRKKIIVIAECAVMVSLATVLSLIKIWESPLGGSVTLFSMLPIIIIGLLHGPKWGLGSALIYSVIQLIFGIGTVSWLYTPVSITVCILLDYIVAYTSLGISGFFRSTKTSHISMGRIISASVTVCVIRFSVHFVCGAVVWYEITKSGAWNEYVFKYSKWLYSFIYNFTYMLPETVMLLVAAPFTAIIVSKIRDNNPVR